VYRLLVWLANYLLYHMLFKCLLYRTFITLYETVNSLLFYW